MQHNGNQYLHYNRGSPDTWVHNTSYCIDLRKWFTNTFNIGWHHL